MTGTARDRAARAKNGRGHTYPYRNGWRTVIQWQGRVVTATGATKAEAQRRAQVKVASARPLNYGKDRVASRLTVGDYLLDWLNFTHKDEIAFTTYKRYLGLLVHHIVPLIGHLNLAKLETRHVNEMLREMKKAGQSDRSRQQARAVLSKGLGAALEEELIAVNVARGSRKVSVRRGQIKPLSAEEVELLLGSVPDPRMQLRWRIALLFGLRQGEALGLRWQDVDLEAMILRVRVQIQDTPAGRAFTALKTESSRRDLYFGPKLASLLDAHREAQAIQKRAAGADWVDHDLVFCNKRGRPIQPTWDSELWHRTLKAVGLEDRRLHDARHTAGTLLYSAGHDIEAIRQFLGHSDIGLTSRTYVHPDAAPMKRIANSTEHF